MSYQQLNPGIQLTDSHNVGGNRANASRGTFLLFFFAVTYFSILSFAVLALSLLVNILRCVVYNDSSFSFLQALIGSYLIIFCVVCILCELEWLELVRYVQLLQNWVARGLFYVFVGATAVAVSFPKVTDHWMLSDANRWPAFCVIGMGLLYAAMGSACLKKIRDERMAAYVQLIAENDITEMIRSNAAPVRIVNVP